MSRTQRMRNIEITVWVLFWAVMYLYTLFHGGGWLEVASLVCFNTWAAACYVIAEVRGKGQ